MNQATTSTPRQDNAANVIQLLQSIAVVYAMGGFTIADDVSPDDRRNVDEGLRLLASLEVE